MLNSKTSQRGGNNQNGTQRGNGSSYRSSQVSSIGVIDENDFETIFNHFKKTRMASNHSQTYEQVLFTVGNAHKRNKIAREQLFKEMASIEE